MSHMEDGGVDTTDTESGQQEMGQMADFLLLLASSVFDLIKHDVPQIQSQTLRHTVGGIAYICFKWFQITADAHPGVSWVSNDQKFCEKFKNTQCQVDHPAKIE